MNWNFSEYIENYYEEELDRIRRVRKSIKHPHFYYATYDIESGEVSYRKKKWYKWFSGKRIVIVKLRPIKPGGLADYAVISSDDGKQR